MTGELFGKWIEALRSGKYFQRRFKLRGIIVTDKQGDKDHVGECGYCCLGVLCEIVKPTLTPMQALTIDSALEEGTALDFIIDESGKTFKELVKLHPGVEGECMEWNDSAKLTFEQIADSLEEKQRKGELV